MAQGGGPRSKYFGTFSVVEFASSNEFARFAIQAHFGSFIYPLIFILSNQKKNKNYNNHLGKKLSGLQTRRFWQLIRPGSAQHPTNHLIHDGLVFIEIPR